MSSFEDQDVNLPRMLIEQCRKRGNAIKIADSTGVKLSGNDLLIRSLVLGNILAKHVLKADEKYVGVLLPPSVPAAVANFALSFQKRVAVNLNYTVSSATLNQCIEMADIKHVLTSRKVLDKLDVKLDAEVVYLEDFRDKASLLDKVSGFVWGKLAPIPMLLSHLGLKSVDSKEPVTIIFTSGSTGIPKGVVLSYGNVASNVHAIRDAIGLSERDVILGILPFFHSFGYTVTLWTAMALPPTGVFHYSPLDAKQIGKLSEQYKATVLLATPTFLRNYMRRVTPDQFKTLEVVVVGAEKMPISVADEFEKTFGIRPLEGYGTTELSPLVSVNLPPKRSTATDPGKGLREGSVGRPVPGVQARIVDLDDRHVLGVNESGMLEIKGPNVMQGYLHQEELTRKVIRDGWYETGDIAMIDEDGYIHITGRQSRFSKIGGEMVPHIQLEEAIHKILGIGEDGKVPAVVTAVPDPKKGERLIVLHTGLGMSASELLKKLSGEGLPNLFLPGEDSFLQVDEIPVLGTGKLDLKGMQTVALAHFGPEKS
ncbi:MAG: AMP-binding protein [Pirellulales bacterium]